MQNATVRVPEAARVLGIPQAKLRQWLRQKKVPYGRAIPRGTSKNGSPHFEYIIYVQKLLEEIGLKEWPGGDTDGNSNMAADN